LPPVAHEPVAAAPAAQPSMPEEEDDELTVDEDELIDDKA
jgi:hypothetical protein